MDGVWVGLLDPAKGWEIDIRQLIYLKLDERRLEAIRMGARTRSLTVVNCGHGRNYKGGHHGNDSNPRVYRYEVALVLLSLTVHNSTIRRFSYNLRRRRTGVTNLEVGMVVCSKFGTVWASAQRFLTFVL